VIRSILASNYSTPASPEGVMRDGVHGGGHSAPDPDVVRSILSGSYPADREQGAVATDGPVVLATTPAGAPAAAADDVTRSAGIEGEHLVSIEAALPDIISRAEHSGDPFMLMLARPGGPATAGVPVPAASPADVADLGAALSMALSPSHVLYSAGAAHLAVVLPGKSQRDAVALTRRAAEGGAPTFTWVACRYPKDARTARGLLQLAAHRLDGADRAVAEEFGAVPWWRGRSALAAIGAAAVLVMALLLATGGKPGPADPTTLHQASGGSLPPGGGSGASGSGGSGATGTSGGATGTSAGSSSYPTHSGAAGGSANTPTGTSAGGATTAGTAGATKTPSGTGSGGGTGTGTTPTHGSGTGSGSGGGSTTGSGSGGGTGNGSGTSSTPTTVPAGTGGTSSTSGSSSSNPCNSGSGGGGLLGGLVGGLLGGLLGGGSSSTCSH
jgi:hypothetical protein